jgi:predicted metalloprotease with PDZ domain
VTAIVRYDIAAADPRAHHFRVRLCWDAAPACEVVFRMPSWIRGSYLIRDFAKHVFGLAAQRGGETVAIERLDKNSFRVPSGSGAIALDYGVYAYDASVRKAWLDERRGFFNAGSLCYRPDSDGSLSYELHLARPLATACERWKVATTLPALEVDHDGFGRYLAPDYETLIDHPVELADFQYHRFDVDGIEHALVVSGRVDFDGERVAHDLQKVCKVERDLFEGEPRLSRYLFLTNVVGSGYGGLEHRESTALICARGDLPSRGDTAMSREYRQFLGLCSHEYFHLWNVKRITADAFLRSDLSKEAYTADLWHYEGVTSYYDDLFLLRAGLIPAVEYLDLVAEQATRLERAPARQLQTLADASFETWIKYYQPDENSPNASLNYYVKGALAALCLDLHLRLHSSTTLDEVMRTLWRRYGAEGVGVPERGLEAVARELSGLPLQSFFDAALRSTAELPLVELLDAFGVGAERRPQYSVIDNGGRSGGRPPLAWAGLRLKPGDTVVAHVLAQSPAQAAGLSAGDKLVAWDGWRLTPASWQRFVDHAVPGQAVSLHYFRDDELLTTVLTPVAPPADTWVLMLREEVPAEVAERRMRWLGC